MINVKFNNIKLNQILNNTVSYSNGFLNGTELAQPIFNQQLGEFIKEALYKYVDAKARMNPDKFHHIYEWDQVGRPGARLFEFAMTPGKRTIRFTGKLLSSNTPSPSSGQIFEDKAKVMENGITITIEPKNAEVLVFENEGQTIFTTKQIEIENPGGPEVAGSFSEIINDFFSNYLTVGLLRGSGLLTKLGYPVEYKDSFSQGTKSGAPAGIKAGKRYLSTKGIDVQ